MAEVNQMEKFIDTYRHLTQTNLDGLGEIYAEDIIFIDPAHEISGLRSLTAYFTALYQNITSPTFRFKHHLLSGGDAYVQWEMDFSHPGLNRGRTITVPGTSYLRFSDSGKVFYHRDYFDLGMLLYEQLPLFGKLFTAIKRRIGS